MGRLECGLRSRGSESRHLEHVLLGRLKHGIEPTQHGHRQNHIAVFAAHIDIAQDVIGNIPDKAGEPVKLSLIHENALFLKSN